MITLKEIEEKTVTLQQEKAFIEYSKNAGQPSVCNFIHFYNQWCFENSRFNDIQQSNF
jgi:hypothetical protein|tara:strand:+ start:206 stop:379 length:174 start_codon:yes stop_codon:yes gene_type:complete